LQSFLFEERFWIDDQLEFPFGLIHPLFYYAEHVVIVATLLGAVIVAGDMPHATFECIRYKCQVGRAATKRRSAEDITKTIALNKTPRYREVNRRAVAAWNERNPAATRARSKLAQAIRKGTISPAAVCQADGCDVREDLEGHRGMLAIGDCRKWRFGGSRRPYAPPAREARDLATIWCQVCWSRIQSSS
jgi:hypothetical protein